jgi:AcrR family transcriptional regulator
MRINPFHRDEYLLVAINRVLATDGVAGLTVRRVAEEQNMAPSTLVHHYGGKERMVGIGAREMVRARHAWLASRSVSHGPFGFLPIDDDSLVAVRAWAGWLELWRSEDHLEELFRDARDDELALLADAVDHALGREDLRGLQALVDGLYDALAEPVRPLRPGTAREILGAHLRRLGLDDTAWVPIA